MSVRGETRLSCLCTCDDDARPASLAAVGEGERARFLAAESEAESGLARRTSGSGVGEDDCDGEIAALLFLLLLRCAPCKEQWMGETTFKKPTFGGRKE